ncbi:MAG: pyridoxal phosphate-dependent aminotransferase [Desulfovibrio sp.]|nr:MAG: pyridoxal phosphate-dependent aminotransferase [Desulfovibrio sp.]
MRLSQRMRQLKPSATMAISAKALDMKAQGKQIISLSVGEPDFPTPQHVQDAAKQAIDKGFHKYTQPPGLPELRRAIAGYFHHFYGVEAPAEATIATNGGKQALYNLFQSIIDPGDEVLVALPYWVSYPALVEMAGGVLKPIPTRVEENFKLQPEDLVRAIGPKTRCLIINSPSNPTGCHYTREELYTLAQLALDKGLFLVSDEIYDRLVFSPAEPISLSPLWEENPEQVAVINGLSKSFAMTGWRIGYALAHPELIKAMQKLQGQTTSNICAVTQKAAEAALVGSWEPVKEMCTAFQRRRDLALDIISGWSRATCPKPDGAFYLFCELKDYFTAQAPDSSSFCCMLLEKAGVALVPGAAFGDDSCLRISYAVDDEVLRTALNKIGEVLAEC